MPVQIPVKRKKGTKQKLHNIVTKRQLVSSHFLRVGQHSEESRWFFRLELFFSIKASILNLCCI